MFQRLLTPKTANEGHFLRFIAAGAEVGTVAVVNGHDQPQEPVEEIFNEDALPLSRRKRNLEKQRGTAIWIQSVAGGNRAREAILEGQFVIGDSILAYDPQDLLNCRFESVRSEQLGPENDSDSQVLTFAKNCDTDEYTQRAGRTKDDMLMRVGNFHLVVSLKFRMNSCMIHFRCRSPLLTPTHP